MAETEAVARRWLWVHLVTLGVVLMVLAVTNRGQWFFGDEWDFLLFRGVFHAHDGLFFPHNEHWSTLPILFYRAVFSVFGVRSYWPYLAGLFALQLTVVHLAWRLMRRAGVPPALATGAALVLGLYGRGSENLTWAFQVGFVGSLAAGLLLVWLIDDRGDQRRVALVAVGGVCALMFSGISVVMIVAVGIVALAKWDWRRALIVTVPAGVTYVLWLVLQGQKGLEDNSSKMLRGGPGDIPRYVFGGISATFGGLVRSDRLGEVLLVLLLVAVVVFARSWWRTAPELLGLAAACPLMFAVISQGRGAILDPAAPRYLNLAAGMLFPLAALAIARLIGGGPRPMMISLVVCLALTVNGVDRLRDDAARSRTLELGLRGQLLASLSVAAHDRLVNDRPDPTYAGSVTVAQIKSLRRHGQLPRATPTVADIAAARLALQVAIADERNPAVQPGTGVFTAGATVTPQGACSEVDLHGTNAVIGRVSDVAVFTIRTAGSGRLLLFAPYTGGNAGPRIAEMTPGRMVTIHDVLDGQLVLQLPGPATICGITWTQA